MNIADLGEAGEATKHFPLITHCKDGIGQEG